MPSLVLFKERTFFAGDDLRCFACLHGIYRLLQLCLAIGLGWVHIFERKHNPNTLVHAIEECGDYGNFQVLMQNGTILFFVYEFTSILLCLVSFFILLSMFNVSGKGTPTDPTLRRPLKPLCYLDIIGLNFLRFSLLVLGCLCLYVVDALCECVSDDASLQGLQDVRRNCVEVSEFVTMLFILVGTHIVDAIMAFLTLIYFTCRYAPQVMLVSSAQRLSLCLRCCCCFSSIFTCCLFGGREAILGDFAEFSLIIADYLNNNDILDLTASDVLMGLDMVMRVRRQSFLETRERLVRESMGDLVAPQEHLEVELVQSQDGSVQVDIEEPRMPEPTKLAEPEASLITSANDTDRENSKVRVRQTLSPSDKQEVYLMAEAAHFVVFAQAAYTWVSYFLEFPITGFFRMPYHILRQCMCCFRSLKTDHIKGDYFWRTHSTALELISGLAPQDIIYASYYDRSDAIPYFIALDHDWKSVVISIRGTMTLESVVSDINCVPHELTEMGEECGFDGNGLFCHRGILHSVVWLYEDLKSHGKLAQAMKDYHSYRLRVVGHSLGAGVASILSVLLHPQYPNLRCLAFSPPGCTMSENLAEAVSEHTYSYIVDDDIIARMSIEGFEELRDSVLDMICRVKIPKYQVGRQAKKHDLLTAEGVSQSINETLYDAEKIKNSAFKEQVEEFWSFQAKLRDERNYVKLCLPGSIVHLFRTRINQSSIRMFDVGMLVGASEDHRKSDSEQNSEQSRRYTARWANRKDFEKIEISSHMLLDHSPIAVKNRIQAAAVEQFGLNENCLLEELEESERREMKSRFYAN